MVRSFIIRKKYISSYEPKGDMFFTRPSGFFYEECDDLRRLGTAAVELTYLAAGRVELYFEIYRR